MLDFVCDCGHSSSSERGLTVHQNRCKTHQDVVQVTMLAGQARLRQTRINRKRTGSNTDMAQAESPMAKKVMVASYIDSCKLTVVLGHRSLAH